MVTPISYITTAIQTVFKNKDDLADAQACLTSGSTPTILSCLDEACSCSFSALANLRNDPPPQAVAVSISTEIAANGGEVPSDIYLKKKVGNTDLTTTAQDLSGATNELDAEIGSDTLTTSATTVKAAINELVFGGGHAADVYTPIGTLGSFYECSSLIDTSPTLIATGANTIAETSRAEHKCIIWAFSQLAISTNSPNSIAHPDYGDFIIFGNGYDNGPNVLPIYASFSSNGGCFSIAENNAHYYSTAMAADSYLICLYALDHYIS